MAGEPARNEDREVADVAVVGGGVVGAAAALGLGQLGFDVRLIEPRRPRPQPGALGVELRTLAVSPASRMLLEGLGAWRGLGEAPYRRMEVWEERGTRAMVFDATEAGRDELGWIVENGRLAEGLWAALETCPSVTVCESTLRDLELGADQADLVLDGGRLSARLVLAADGAESALRGLVGVGVRAWDVGHHALVTVARMAQPHGGVAYQRFLLDGPVALLPTAEAHLCSVIWSQSPGEAERRRALDEAALCKELGRAVQGRLGEVQALDRWVTFPLRQQLAASFNPEPRVLLLGDAARVVHPLAGLGANLGFEDVRAVLEQLGQPGAGAGSDPGAPGRWEAFDRRRSTRARLMLDVLLGLRRVYSLGDPLSQWVRNTGISWLDRAAPVKRQIMREAMGLGPVAAS